MSNKIRIFDAIGWINTPEEKRNLEACSQVSDVYWYHVGGYYGYIATEADLSEDIIIILSLLGITPCRELETRYNAYISGDHCILVDK